MGTNRVPKGRHWRLLLLDLLILWLFFLLGLRWRSEGIIVISKRALNHFWRFSFIDVLSESILVIENVLNTIFVIRLAFRFIRVVFTIVKRIVIPDVRFVSLFKEVTPGVSHLSVRVTARLHHDVSPSFFLLLQAFCFVFPLLGQSVRPLLVDGQTHV